MKTRIILSSLCLFFISNCGLKEDLQNGFTVYSRLSKKYDCLDSGFSESILNGKRTVKVKLTCEDETGLYNGRVLLEIHRQLKATGMKVDFYEVNLIKHGGKSVINALDLDLGLQIEEKALKIKESFQKKEFDFILKNSHKDLVADIEKQNLFIQTDSLIQAEYPNYSGFNYTQTAYQYGFECQDNHCLVIMFDSKERQLISIRYN